LTDFLSIIASTITIFATIITTIITIAGVVATKEVPTKIIQKGNNNSVHIGKKKIKVKNIFIPTEKQIIKIEHAGREGSSSANDPLLIGLFAVGITLFGILFFSYLYYMVLILLGIFLYRFIKYIRYTIAIKLNPDLYDRSRFYIYFTQQLLFFGILISLLFFSAHPDFQAVAQHVKFDFSMLKEGGSTFSNWFESVTKYIFSIFTTTPFTFFFVRSAGIVFLIFGMFYSTGKGALPIYSQTPYRKKELLSDLGSFILIVIVFFTLYPWVFLDLKNSLEPLWETWASK